MRISVGTKLYLSVLSVFLVFAVGFIVFQQTREKQYKVDTLNLKLQDYNTRMEEYLHLFPDYSEQALDAYVKSHNMPHLRVTLISPSGHVMYDSSLKQSQRSLAAIFYFVNDGFGRDQPGQVTGHSLQKQSLFIPEYAVNAGRNDAKSRRQFIQRRGFVAVAPKQQHCLVQGILAAKRQWASLFEHRRH